MSLPLRLRLLLALLLAVAIAALIAGVAAWTTGSVDHPRADCVQVWSFFPYPHLVWDCGPAGGGGGGSW
jgi:hypothetical protein